MTYNVRVRSLGVLVVVVGCALGCSRATEADAAKRMPKPPPSASADISDNVRIDVEIDGKPAPRIDAASLAQTKPDFVEGDKRAWKLASLVGEGASRPGATLSVTGERGLVVTMPAPKTSADPVPVLVVTRRGETVAALTKPTDPFPAYHGHGGMLHRPGDPLPRISAVSKVSVAFAEPEPSAQHVTLRAEIAGRPAETWGLDRFARVPRWGDAGAARDAWSLRDVAHTLVGPKARVVAVRGGGKRKVIERSEWDDLGRTPLLRPNREEQMKFRWIEKNGALGEAEVKQVDAVEIDPGS